MKTISKTVQIPSAARMTPDNSADVVRAVNEARAAGLRLAVVSTGHGIAPLGDLSEAFVIDVSGLDSVEIDTAHRIARVGGGATWESLLEHATRVGLTAPFGSGGSVGVAGYCLGGGVGPMARFLGLGSSAVRSVDLVTVDGIEMRVDGISDPELLWGLKGGGSGLGVITALELDLCPMPELTGGMLIWPIERAAEVGPAWAEWTRYAPASLTTSLRLVQNEPGEGLAMITVASPASEGAVAEQLEDLMGMAPVGSSVRGTDPSKFVAENGDPDGGPPVWLEHALIDQLPDEAVCAAIEFADPAKGSELLMSEFRHLGGALARASSRGGALDQVDANFSYAAIAPPEHRLRAEHAADCLSDFGRGRSLLNFCREPADPRMVFEPDTIIRLGELHSRLDPNGVMLTPHR